MIKLLCEEKCRDLNTKITLRCIGMPGKSLDFQQSGHNNFF